jgi:hypothetical protein
VPLTQLELDNFNTPSYRVHVYHDTGRRFATPDGKHHRVLEAQGDYGWFIIHKGANGATPWTADTALNADPRQRSGNRPPHIVKIRPDWWRLSIEHGGFVTLTSTVTADGSRGHHCDIPLWIILLTILVVAVVLMFALVRRRP